MLSVKHTLDPPLYFRLYFSLEGYGYKQKPGNRRARATQHGNSVHTQRRAPPLEADALQEGLRAPIETSIIFIKTISQRAIEGPRNLPWQRLPRHCRIPRMCP